MFLVMKTNGEKQASLQVKSGQQYQTLKKILFKENDDKVEVLGFVSSGGQFQEYHGIGC